MYCMHANCSDLVLLLIWYSNIRAGCREKGTWATTAHEHAIFRRASRPERQAISTSETLHFLSVFFSFSSTWITLKIYYIFIFSQVNGETGSNGDCYWGWLSVNQGADTKAHCFHHGVLCWFPFPQVKWRMRGCYQVCVKENSNKWPGRGEDRCNYWQRKKGERKKRKTLWMRMEWGWLG